MSLSTPTLHLICGKIAAGKSTLASGLANDSKTVLISEDDWLGTLFADQMTTGADYVRCASKLKTAMGPHVVSLLESGVSVVLDFPANTVEDRSWMHDILKQASAVHKLHVLDVPDEVCLSRLRMRNAQGDHPFAPTEAQFHQFSKHYVVPSPEEGFTIVVHKVSK